MIDRNAVLDAIHLRHPEQNIGTDDRLDIDMDGIVSQVESHAKTIAVWRCRAINAGVFAGRNREEFSFEAGPVLVRMSADPLSGCPLYLTPIDRTAAVVAPTIKRD